MRLTAKETILDEAQVPWLEILDTLLRRRKLIYLTALTGLLLAVLAAWSEPRVYKATARIQLTAQALSGPRVASMTDRQILAELNMLKSPGLLRTMLDNAPVDANPTDSTGSALTRFRRTTGRLLRAPFSLLAGGNNIAPTDRQTRSLAANIEISRVQNTNVVEVAFKSDQPAEAARFVNSLLVHHIRRIASLSEGNETRTFYEEQAVLLAEQWENATQELLAFRREHGATSSTAELQRILTTLEAQRVAAETQALELQATIDFLSRQMQVVPKTVAGELIERRDESVDLLMARLLELRITRIELLSTYTPDSTVVRDIDRQINELEELLVSSEDRLVAETSTEPNPSRQALEVQLLGTETGLNATRARLNALDTQIASYRQRLAQIEQVEAQLTQLESAVEAARRDHETYLNRTESARLESALDASGSVNLTIIDRAEVPLSPLPSKRRFMLLLGATLGLLAGVIGAFGADLLDPSLKSGRQAGRLTGLPVIAEIPLDPRSANTS